MSTELELAVQSLPDMHSRDRKIAMELLELYYLSEEQARESYWQVAGCLYRVREEGIYHYWGSLESAWKALFGISKQRGYQLLSALEARQVVLDLGEEVYQVDDVDLSLLSDVSERQMRELAKVETEQAQADVFVKAVETAPVDKKTRKPKVTASHIARVRKAMGNTTPTTKKRKKAPKEPETVTHLKGMVASIDTIRVRIDELKSEHRPKSSLWQEALDTLDLARIALQKLASR